MSIYESIKALTGYGLTTKLITQDDVVYVQNRLLETLGLDGFDEQSMDSEIPDTKIESLESILKSILDYAAENGLIENNSVVYRDLFDTRVMSCLVDRPSAIRSRFD